MCIQISFWRTIVGKSKVSEMIYYPFDEGKNYKWETEFLLPPTLRLSRTSPKCQCVGNITTCFLGPRSYKFSKNTWSLPSTSSPLFCTFDQSPIAFVSMSNITCLLLLSIYTKAFWLLSIHNSPNCPQILNLIYLTHKSDNDPVPYYKTFSLPVPTG